jgi:hypothetical protein
MSMDAWASAKKMKRRKTMTEECLKCPYATYDCETYYNTCQKQWFVDGCKKDLDETDCKEFEAEEDNGTD